MSELPEPHIFEVAFDLATLERVRPFLFASLFHQNRALRKRLMSDRARARLRTVGLYASGIGLGLTQILLLAFYAGIGSLPWWMVFLFLFLFSASFVLFYKMEAIDRWTDRLPASTLRWSVSRALKRLAKKCPYTIVYALDEAGVTARSDELGVDRRIRFDDYRFVLATAPFFHFYRTAKAISPKAVVYFDDDDTRLRIEAALLAANVEVVFCAPDSAT